MKYLLQLLLSLPLFSFAQNFSPAEVARWEAQAKQVNVIEDQWGIPHIYGKTDADAVFGLLYVQCTQNFSRVERNYLEIMGRLSEVEGEKWLYDDLQMRLIYDSAAAKKDYEKSPVWFKKLLDAFADGVNYYLYKHPAVKPLALKKFEPWFPLMYTDGSIAPTQTGGLTVQDLKNFYEGKDDATSFVRPELSAHNFEPSGSNGFALAPSKTASKNAMLYINPHVTFYFRTEAHMVSEEGLDAYGAVTWGQFFIYQGFNEHCGWMHTSSYADVADVYEETIRDRNGNIQYLVADSIFFQVPGKTNSTQTETMAGEKKNFGRPLQKEIEIAFKNETSIGIKKFTTYKTHHGPIMGNRAGKWLSLKEANRSLSALMQSWLRTKAKGFDEFKKVMDMRSNNSNNTVFADSKGNIAYWHGNFLPRRNPKYDWTMPVDGSTSETEWKGIHTLDEIIHLYNPKSGWIQNCNSTPFTVSGGSSPKPKDYPTYMAPEGENGRGVTAARLLSNVTNVTLDKLIELGYNTYLSSFDILLPALFKAYDALPATDAQRTALKEPIALLKSWDKQSAASSVATTLAIEWGFKLSAKLPPAKTTEAATHIVANHRRMADSIPAAEKLALLAETLSDLQKLYGAWNIAWGEVNRFQRTANNSFSDDSASIAVGLGPAAFGSLPSFVSSRFNTKKRYGTRGNSFVAAVEFGKRLKAKTIMTGGESFDPASPHFTDQASGFIHGKFKDVNFYKEDVLKNAQRSYHPGE